MKLLLFLLAVPLFSQALTIEHCDIICLSIVLARNCYPVTIQRHPVIYHWSAFAVVAASSSDAATSLGPPGGESSPRPTLYWPLGGADILHNKLWRGSRARRCSLA